MPLASLSDFKAFAGYTDTSRDVPAQLLLDAGVAELQRLLGRNFTRGAYRDTFQSFTQKLYLNEPLIEYIVGVTVGGTTVPPNDYTLYQTSGVLAFNRGALNSCADCVVTYVGGVDTLPPDLTVALYSAVQAVDAAAAQTSQYGGPVKRLSVYDVGVTDLAVPRDGASRLSDLLSDALSSRYVAALGGWALRESEFLSGSTTPGGGTPVWTPVSSSVLEVLIDEVSPTLTYVCDALIGSATSAAVWRIKKIETVGTVTTVVYAGTGAFDQVADDRASLF